MRDIMIDLETLGTTPDAVVLSLGAVVFDPYSSVQGPTFYVEFTNFLERQTDQGRTINPNTVLWWMQQNQGAREVFQPRETDVTRCSPLFGASAFSAFVKENGCDRVWAKDPDFDVVILRSFFNSINRGEAFPFKYNAGRSVRTVMDMPFAKHRASPAVAHNALADAIQQATDIQGAFACLRTQSLE